jgi:NTE family protein
MSTNTQERSPALGLALSGGGFRAAFFHIGVLAQLARYGVLRNVEVISTVSGGSVIGALYYLELQRELERVDSPLGGDDATAADRRLCELLARIEAKFLRAVEHNLRTRTLLNPYKILKMALPHYSRSDRVAELYNEYFYREFRRSRALPLMRELVVAPAGDSSFSPKRRNAARVTKVPMLLLNATSLNTGHNWRFEALWMGEHIRESKEAKVIDKNEWLSRTSYDTLDDRLYNFPLPHAVAASTAVPGVFPPMSITGMYPEETRVKLVDGGVHDNQGLQGLIDMGCERVIVSDASGQLTDIRSPSSDMLPVLTRSVSVLSDRVREEQLHAMMSGERPYLFLHLRRGVTPRVVKTVAADEAGASTRQRMRADLPEMLTPYQDDLARVRTDLDSFSEVEAYSLMLNGYKMVEADLRARFEEFGRFTAVGSRDAEPALTPDFAFLALDRHLKSEGRPRGANKHYQKHIEAAAHGAFKVFRLAPVRAWLAALSLAAAVALVYLGLRRLSDAIGPLPGGITLFWAVILLPFAASLLTAGALGIMAAVPTPTRPKVLSTREYLRVWLRVYMRVPIAVVMPLVVLTHLRLFDRMFLEQGRLRHLR